MKRPDPMICASYGAEVVASDRGSGSWLSCIYTMVAISVIIRARSFHWTEPVNISWIQLTTSDGEVT